jgi:phage-related protein
MNLVMLRKTFTGFQSHIRNCKTSKSESFWRLVLYKLCLKFCSYLLHKFKKKKKKKKKSFIGYLRHKYVCMLFY